MIVADKGKEKEICINQLFHEDNCHIVAFIAQENQVKWSPDLILPENVPVPILKTTKEGKKNLGPILEFIETPEVEAAKKLWINIYNEKQAIREKPPEWIQAKYDRLETIRSKREEIKKKQLEAANSTVTNLSPVSFSVQEITGNTKLLKKSAVPTLFNKVAVIQTNEQINMPNKRILMMHNGNASTQPIHSSINSTQETVSYIAKLVHRIKN
ncbi:Uncharacterized protein APZ42_030695 [Daphnia magna]|uniref:Uncharacterized protein n=1 Tax=Daphnia magna TaxID=35525 RepID=A0A164NHR4_9CRUS|nr:Uncharacterized protein APZ42_030695 [Daphnia magna]